MKILALLFVIGCASASFYDALDNASDELLVDFFLGMEKTPSLSEVIGYSEETNQIDNDIKTNIGQSLKEALDGILEKVREAVDQGKKVGEELVTKAKDIISKLKEMGIDAGNKGKELLERLKEKAKEWLKNLLEKLGLGKRGIVDWIKGLFQDFSIKALLQKLKEKIAEKLSIEGILSYVKNLFGDSLVGKVIFNLIKTKGIQAIKDLIARILPSKEASADYSLLDQWEKIKDFFKGVGVDLKEKFKKFAEWVRVTVQSGFENAKTKAEKLKALAKEVIEKSKTLTKETAREVVEFFRPHKEELGTLFDELKEAARRVILGGDEY